MTSTKVVNAAGTALVSGASSRLYFVSVTTAAPAGSVLTVYNQAATSDTTTPIAVIDATAVGTYVFLATCGKGIGYVASGFASGSVTINYV
jgi:hypothetical protein